MTFAALLLALLAAASTSPASAPASAPAVTTRPVLPDSRFVTGELLFADDFRALDPQKWVAELERPGTVAARDGRLEIDVPAGCTVWFKPILDGPVMIEYDATVVAQGGKNDRVSDLNCFWMAIDARTPDDLFALKRTGRFADYDQLRCYYVGLGGNGNTTTRFRRYIGEKENRPLRPDHDLRGAADLITPNVPQKIRLIAAGNVVQFWRGQKKLFELDDPAAYTRGHFALRTVTSHLSIRNFRVYRLRETEPVRPAVGPAVKVLP